MKDAKPNDSGQSSKSSKVSLIINQVNAFALQCCMKINNNNTFKKKQFKHND